MGIRKHSLTLVSDGSSVGTGYTGWLTGYLESIQYIKAGALNYTDGVDFTITAEATGESLWVDTNINASETVRPRADTHSTAGVASLYAGGGTAVTDRIALGSDRIKVVLAQAGATKTGQFIFTISDR